MSMEEAEEIVAQGLHPDIDNLMACASTHLIHCAALVSQEYDIPISDPAGPDGQGHAYMRAEHEEPSV